MEYQHFSIHTLDEGVFAAIHKEGGAAHSNAGIIDLGGSTVVFDTFDLAVAAKELLIACKELTGRAPAWVVNSHKHGDHWGGNQVFVEEAVIVATHQTRSGMLGWGEELAKLGANPREIEMRIEQLERKLQGEKDLLQRATLERSLVRNRYMLADLPHFVFTPPTLTFSGTISFRGSGRSVELTSVEHAHTPEECYLTLPGTRIIFTGDLAFFACPPFIAQDSSLDGWMNMLEILTESDFECFIPGHGPIGNHVDLKRQREYLAVMLDLVKEAVEKKLSLEDILGISEPSQFKKWGVFPQRHENNLRSIYFQITQKLKGGA
jgi:cyclase